MNKSIIFCGVGGDGIVTASNICANALLRANFDVKKSEVHGMSQRGGSVNAFLIYGKKSLLTTTIKRQCKLYVCKRKVRSSAQC